MMSGYRASLVLLAMVSPVLADKAEEEELAGPLVTSLTKIPESEYADNNAPSQRRAFAPVVISGKQADALIGADPRRIVAYRYDEEWVQVPVQVDERDRVGNRFLLPLRKGRAGQAAGRVKQPSEKKGPLLSSDWADHDYTCLTTRTGSDSDPAFDENDEICFMYRDCGGEHVPASPPPDMDDSTRVECRITDPLTKEVAYLYLFVATKDVDPSAGKDYVQYDFKLNSGSYIDTWDDGNVNPENSWIHTPVYSRHFTKKVVVDQLVIKKPYGTGVDILDERKFLLALGKFNRSYHTASGAGAIIANVDGPVRAIRSAYKFNSAAKTRFHYYFYDRLEVYCVDGRPTHQSVGVVLFDDHNENAIGMRYRNSSNPAGVVMDGEPDEYQEGPCYWELISGEQGGFCKLTYKNSNQRPHPNPNKRHGKVTGFYLDSRDPNVAGKVLNDDVVIGASGVRSSVPLRRMNRRIGEMSMTYQKYFHGLQSPTPDLAKRILQEEIHPLEVTCERPARQAERRWQLDRRPGGKSRL